LPVQIEVTNPVHVDVLERVLRNHPAAKTKIGCGIAGFFVRRSLAEMEGGRLKDVCCCFVRRTDETEEDFSMFRCYNSQSWKSDGTTHFDAKSQSLKKF
jgi:hypothetical protein